MAEILDQLQINKTFFVQFGLFAAFFFILSEIYLKPFQKLILKRNHKLKNDVESSNELLKSIDTKLAEYEKLLSSARTESRVQYEKVLSDVRAKEDAQIATFKDELKKDYAKLSQQLGDEKRKVESELKAQVTQMADAIAEKTLSGK